MAFAGFATVIFQLKEIFHPFLQIFQTSPREMILFFFFFKFEGNIKTGWRIKIYDTRKYALRENCFNILTLWCVFFFFFLLLLNPMINAILNLPPSRTALPHVPLNPSLLKHLQMTFGRQYQANSGICITDAAWVASSTCKTRQTQFLAVGEMEF